MKRILVAAAVVAAMTGCATSRTNDSRAYENPFYAKYLNTGSALDAHISRTLEAIRQNPGSAELHNVLGAALVEKGFPKDAEREFERAVDVDGRYYPAWYNLGLVRASHGDEIGARRAFSHTVDLKPGHAAALFQLALVEEKRDHIDRAIGLYAKAFSINPALMRVDVNPRILDTKLTHLALLRMYPKEHNRRTMEFQGGPISREALGTAGPVGTTAPAAQAPSPQQPAQNIVPPSAPTTDPGVQPAQEQRPATVAPPSATRRRTPSSTANPGTGRNGRPLQPFQVQQPDEPQTPPASTNPPTGLSPSATYPAGSPL